MSTPTMHGCHWSNESFSGEWADARWRLARYGAVMALKIMTHVRVVGGAVKRLMCHPRLPLIACWDSERPVVRVWDYANGDLRDCGIVGAYSAAWHPHEPRLAVAVDGEVVYWTPDGVSELASAPASAAYDDMAFSPDGHTLWASPASTGDDDAWECSDVLDLVSGAVGHGPRWDTGVAVHPGGGLVVTLRSDQAETCLAFGRVDGKTTSATMRMLRRTRILAVDGYQTPIFSANGRHFAVLGNAYENTLEVFAFPSLERILAATLGRPNPGIPYPDGWLEQMRAWARNSAAFGDRPDILWIGTPAGILIELNVCNQHMVEHDVLADSPITALAATATGELAVASGAGKLSVLSVSGGTAEPLDLDRDSLEGLVNAFVEMTSEMPEDARWTAAIDFDEDGGYIWVPSDLEIVTDGADRDPSRLQIHPSGNSA